MTPDKQTDDPMFHAPFQQPVPEPAVVTPPTDPAEPPVKSKLLPTITVLSLIELIVIIVLIIAVAADSKPKPAANSNKNTDNSQAQGPTPATSSSVQLTDDSISQDLSSLNDDKDFPADKFSDQSLNL